MLLDLLFIVLMITALVKGYRNGLVVAVFSLLGLLIGLAAALKLSVIMAEYLKGSLNVSVKWLPVLSFILVFLLAVFLVRLGAVAVEKLVQLAMLGWLNRLGGIVLYIVLFVVVLSVGVFYLEKLNLLTPQSIASSKTYPFIKPWGLRAIGALGTVIPFFRNMFQELETFFGQIARIKN